MDIGQLLSNSSFQRRWPSSGYLTVFILCNSLNTHTQGSTEVCGTTVKSVKQKKPLNFQTLFCYATFFTPSTCLPACLRDGWYGALEKKAVQSGREKNIILNTKFVLLMQLIRLCLSETPLCISNGARQHFFYWGLQLNPSFMAYD